jgi:protein-S-isoprenylcysteine O-methyltransferase Ste14
VVADPEPTFLRCDFKVFNRQCGWSLGTRHDNEKQHNGRVETDTMTAAGISKSLLHNLGVVAVGFAFAALGRGVDSLIGVTAFNSALATAAGAIFLVVGFALRVWATCLFYEQGMRVISLVPQDRLITSGPWRFTRNPLYLGGNFFVFLGAVLLLGSPSGIVFTAAELVGTDVFIRREERQLARDFGEEWERYRSHVRRWL